MIIVEYTIGTLTLNTLYQVKFAVLQRTPSYIKVTTTANGYGTVQFYDSTGTTLQDTQQLLLTEPVWQIDTTQ